MGSRIWSTICCTLLFVGIFSTTSFKVGEREAGGGVNTRNVVFLIRMHVYICMFLCLSMVFNI